MRPHPSLRLIALSAGTAALLMGCASLDPAQRGAWRVDPMVKLVHGGDVAGGRAYLALGQAYQGEGRWQQAADTYAKAVYNDPGNAEAYHALGIAQATLRHPTEAVAAFSRAVDLAPENAQYLNNLGYALLLSGQYARGLPYLQAALAREPGYEQARKNVAIAESLLKVMAEAPAPRDEAVVVVPAAAPQAAVVAVGPIPSAPVAVVAPFASVAPVVAVVPASPVAVAAPVAPIAIAAPTAAIVPVAPVAPIAPTAPVAPVVAAGPVAQPGPTPTASAIKTELAAKMVSAATDAPLHGFRIEIANGNGVENAAARLRDWLRTRGVDGARLINLKPYNSPSTVVQYQPGYRTQALAVAQRMPSGVGVAPAAETTARADLRVVIGRDVMSTAQCANAWPCAADTTLADAGSSPVADRKF